MTKVMLAEDDDTMVTLLKTLLTMEGYQVAVLDVGEKDVLGAVRREAPDVLLLDVYLPRQDGTDVIRALRQSADLKDTVVLMTSGMNLKEKCMARGANDFLLKPFMPEDLLSMLERHLLSAS